jgi:hypothetical protein
MHPAMAPIAVIFLALFLISYALAGFGVPLGIVPSILAAVAGVLILIGK